MRSLVIKHLAKCTEPIGSAERALDDLCRIYPNAERLQTARARISGVGKQLQEFMRGREEAARRYEQRAA